MLTNLDNYNFIVPSWFVVYLVFVHHQTPMRIVDCLCCGSGVLEVKYPSCMRTEGFDAALERPSFGG